MPESGQYSARASVPESGQCSARQACLRMGSVMRGNVVQD